jgi:hypothetical protein
MPAGSPIVVSTYLPQLSIGGPDAHPQVPVRHQQAAVDRRNGRIDSQVAAYVNNMP